MTHVRNVDRKMKVQTEENFQKTIMDEITNLKKAGRSHNEANEAVASPKISKKNLPQMKNS